MSNLPPDQPRPPVPPPPARGCALEALGFLLMLPALVGIFVSLVFWDFSYLIYLFVFFAIPFAIGVVLVLKAYRA